MRCRRTKVVEQVIVGTHGTLHNWIGRRQLPLRGLRILVFDEADEMLKVRTQLRPVSMFWSNHGRVRSAPG